jgi:SAM-dependent methyltransferase
MIQPPTRMDAAAWDQRYTADTQVWSVEPNVLAAESLSGLKAGRALDVAAGEGRMALWLARAGWQVTALDFSPVGLAKAQTRADLEGVRVEVQVADATTADLGDACFELVIVLYLHLPRADMEGVLRRCQRAVAPGGTLFVLGHDRDNLQRGTGGPQDPDLLYDTELLDPGPGWEAVRLEHVDRDTDSGTAIDTVLLARRHAGWDEKDVPR